MSASRLSPAQLERLHAEMDRARYRERHALRIIGLLVLITLCCIAAFVASLK